MEFFIGNLPHDMTENDLRTAFQQYGNVSALTIPKDLFTGEPKGLAFITVEPERRENKILNIDRVVVKGKVLNIEQIDVLR